MDKLFHMIVDKNIDYGEIFKSVLLSYNKQEPEYQIFSIDVFG